MKLTEDDNTSNPLEQFLGIQRTRDYFDDGDLDKERYEALKKQILDNQKIVQKVSEVSKGKHFGQCDGCYPLWNWLDDNHKEILEDES